MHGSTVAFKFLADKADEKKEEKKDKTEEDEIVIVEVMKVIMQLKFFRIEQ